MKTKKIKVQIKSLDNALNEFTDCAKKIKKGKKINSQQKSLYLADVQTARSIFTEGRLKIIQVLKSEKPESIYALAKLLKRDFKNVYDDVVFLAQLEVLTLKNNKTGRKQKVPQLICDKILFEMAA